jgi:hypothetical protein
MSDQLKLRLKPGPAGKGNSLTVEFNVLSLHTKPIYVMTRATDIRGKPRPHEAYLALEAERGVLHAFLGKPPAPLTHEDGTEVLPFSCLLQPGETFTDHLRMAAPVLDWDPYAENEYGSSFPVTVVDTLVLSMEYFAADGAASARPLPDSPPYFLADAASRKTIAAALLLPAPIPVMRVTPPAYQLPFPRHYDPPSPPEEEQATPEAGAAPAAAAAPLPGIPDPIPATVAAAPPAIGLPDAIAAFFEQAWKASFKGRSAVQNGAVLARSAAGGLLAVNRAAGSAHMVLFNRQLPPGQKLVGIFHTRPYLVGGGSLSGVSLSAADATYLLKHGDSVIMSQCGNEQLMFLRTLETPAEVDHAKLAADHSSRLGKRLAQGRSFAQATQEAAGELARALRLAYYQGSKGILRKVGA